MAASEKLTIQALKEHDKVQPKLKAVAKSPTSVTSSSKSKDKKESKTKDHSVGRSRTLSNSDAQSKRSENVQGRSGGMTFFRIVAATRAWQRLAKKKKRTAPAQKTVANLENTYKLGPDDGKHFLPDKAEEILKEVFDSRLNGTTYSSEKSKLIATDLAAVVKGKIKALETPRYKIVCNVIIMENKDQSMRIVSRSIWNTDTDSYATYTFRNSSIIAVGYVHAVYFE